MKFSVVGFVKDASGVAGLYLGKQEGKDLVYHRQGWHRLVSNRFQPNPEKSQYGHYPKVEADEATWVEPTFIAEVEYRDITSEGMLRQSSFKGLSKRN